MSEYIGVCLKTLSILSLLLIIEILSMVLKVVRLLVTPPKSDLDLNLQSSSPHFLWLNPTAIVEASKASNAFCERIHENQLQANERPIQHYLWKTTRREKCRGWRLRQRSRSSTGSSIYKMINRFFGQVKQVDNRPSYKIRNKYGLLDCNFLMSELMPLPSTIDLETPVPAPHRKIKLDAVAAREGTTDKVL